MTTQTLTVTEFVLARIAEDEADADGIDRYRIYDDARWNPARVLAQCAAMRKIVERCAQVDYAMPSTHLAHGLIAELASIWADHPDFRQEWRA
jgi:hypothetical protein